MVEISIKRVDPELPLPSYAHPGDAGADLHSAVDRVVLFESITGGGPARYEPLEVVPLSGA